MNLVALKPVPHSAGTIEKGQLFNAAEQHAADLIGSGHAAPAGSVAAWSGIRWPGATVVILASGPSLTVEQCEAVQVWRKSAGGAGAAESRRCIAINTTFRRAPWADVLYACDASWWRLYHGEVEAGFIGEKWTQDFEARRFARHIESRRAPGLGKRPGVIHQGGNSGYQAINLAYQAGARKIILVGFDMHGTHWHGKYENGLPNTQEWLFRQWLANFEQLAADLKAEGVEVVNCTPGSALTCFRAASLGKEMK